MRINLNRLIGERADSGRHESWIEIAEKTGIRRATLYSISRGEIKEFRPEHIDALCKYFAVTAGELIEAEDISLPIELNLRPDRRKPKNPALAKASATLRQSKRSELNPLRSEPLPDIGQAPDAAEAKRRAELVEKVMQRNGGKL